jgi:hypothetical protein
MPDGLVGDMKLSVVIPALNEENGLGRVLREIPIAELSHMGYETEVVVVDDGSIDSTPVIALAHGATVVVQPDRGYGNAYKAGFAYATGDVIATGDADLTYPFSDLPAMLQRMEATDLDFINTDRLSGLGDGVMCRSHVFGNWLLSLTAKVLFRLPFRDSESGMWVFRSHVWDALNVQSSGMPFSRELKIEAYARGFKCQEIPITYRARAGRAKLNTITDGLGNIVHMIKKRLSLAAERLPAKALRSATIARGRGRAIARDQALAVEGAGTGSVWDERWFDPLVHTQGIPVEKWAALTIPVGGDASALPSRGQRGMVVWHPKPRVRHSSSRPGGDAGVRRSYSCFPSVDLEPPEFSTN